MRTSERRQSWLFVLQPSVKDASSQRYALSSDSTWNQVCNLVFGLTRNRTDINVTIAVPSFNRSAARTNYRNLATARLPQAVRFQPFPYSPSVLASRVHFDTTSFGALLGTADFDFIWLSEPTHVLGVKTLLLGARRLNKTKILTGINWIDTAEDPKIDRRCSYFLRQVEGVYHSDAAIFNSNSAIAQFQRNAGQFYKAGFVNNLLSKTHVVPPSFDSGIITGTRPRRSANVPPVFIFNHRLHDLPFYRSNWERVFNICRLLIAEGLQFRVIATDTPSTEIRQRYPFLEFRQLGYPDYVELLHRSDIAAGLFQRPGMWSMSLVETMASGCATVVPNHSGYLELAPTNYQCLSSGILTEDRDLIRKLIMNKKFRRTAANDGQRFVRAHFDSTNASSRILKICEGLRIQ